MPRKCTICPHANRNGIESAHLNGQPFRMIATQFNVSGQAVQRHVKTHLPARMAKAAEKREIKAGESLLKTTEENERKEIAAGSGLLDRLSELNKISRAILADCFKKGERGLALQAISRLEKQLELEARLIGEIKDNQVNVVNLQITASEAERIARTFLQGPLPTYIEAALSETSAEPGS
jgi:hypothetical protein